jgi:hypothetical protein
MNIWTKPNELTHLSRLTFRMCLVSISARTSAILREVFYTIFFSHYRQVLGKVFSVGVTLKVLSVVKEAESVHRSQMDIKHKTYDTGT